MIALLRNAPYCFRNDLLLRGASIDYQKKPSFSTNLPLRFLSTSQPMVAQVIIPDVIDAVSKNTQGRFSALILF